MNSIAFGPAGNGDSFSAMGYKKTAQAAEYTARFGLNAYEVQCGRGVRVSPETAAELRADAGRLGIRLSLHAPYYISLSSVEEEKRDKSVEYILESARAADMLGASRIIVHTGSATKITREQALSYASETLVKARRALDEAGLENICICPETMGKLGQLGTLEEVLTLCQLDERMIPCIDFGHLNARTCGGLNTYEAFLELANKMENMLGSERARNFHSHFSKIEYTSKGEVRHLTFEDTAYGPEFEPLCRVLLEKKSCPTIICESAGTQAEDAQYMKNVYALMSGKEKA